MAHPAVKHYSRVDNQLFNIMYNLQIGRLQYVKKGRMQLRILIWEYLVPRISRQVHMLTLYTKTKQNDGTHLNKLNWQIDYSLPISTKGVLIVFASNGVLGWCLQRQFNGIKNLFEWFKSPAACNHSPPPSSTSSLLT